MFVTKTGEKLGSIQVDPNSSDPHERKKARAAKVEEVAPVVEPVEPETPEPEPQPEPEPEPEVAEVEPEPEPEPEPDKPEPKKAPVKKTAFKSALSKG